MNKKIYFYRITHIENIPHILRNGITHIQSPKRNPNYIGIGDDALIAKRQEIILPNGKRLGDYSPFYFGRKMPMLYVIQNGFNGVQKRDADQIVYCVSSVQTIIDLNIEFIFSDGHAVSNLSAFYDKRDIPNLETLIDFQAVNADFWNNPDDTDLKRRKEAEFLALGDIPIEAVLGYIVYSERSKATLLRFGIAEEKIVIRPQDYF